MTPATTPIRLLLVEDNPLDVRLFREMLKQAEGVAFELVHVERIADAAKAIAQGSFQVILADLSLPDSTGMETVERVKRLASETPVIVLTGTSDQELAMHALAAGTQDYLVKGQADGPALLRSIRYAIERKRAEWVERERLNLQEAVRGMNQVMGVVAHELRTPLASLRIIAEYLLTEQNDAAQTEHFVQSIHDEVLRMSEMVNNLLEAARLESGAAKWRWSTVPLAKVCADAVDVVRPILRDDDTNRAVLTADVEPPDLSFKGDPDAIRRLLVNLLSNAIKHTPWGTITVTGEMMMRDGQRWVRIVVRDTGCGIPTHISHRLGTAFALNSGVVGPGNVSGTGLGLAICKGIAAAHGGTIAVASESGRGTTFTACLQADLPEPAILPDDLRIIREVAA